ncbi:TRAP-type C4-dicarboxylate transport system, permease component [Candidatus Vecturithrix granuli]|uniref:TRAP-type C4-dicarboxylate transport system, permease component n=1 Tax=Vecturithrix granuli TaxID=1499967 RepID=A0A081BZV7_VECG1|nr:TRAP-type C4-dicarboxylate transport system, permease component [Candidatus Vecturithrix granuli]
MGMTAFFLLWFLFLVFGMPIFFSLGLISLIYLMSHHEVLLSVPQRLTLTADSFPLLAAPFFILMGNLMNTSGVTRRIFNFADCLVGHIKGGLGHANVVASMIFAGMSGAAVADAAGLGTIEIEAMKEGGYDIDFSAAITAASSTIGPIIPPSLPMIIYGVLANTSVGGLFLGGVIPGFLMGLALMIYVYLYARNKNYPHHAFPKLREFFNAFQEAFLSLLTPVILLGGIFSGMFTPTEAAAVAAFYALLLGFFYHELTLKDFPKIILQTVETNAVVMALVMTASLFGWVITRAQVPQMMGKFLVGISSNPLLILLIINLFLLFVGCFMEAIAAQMILVPILLPVVLRLGISPIHFGVMMVLNLMIGTLTPPIGVVLYVTAKVADISFEEVTKATFPFLVPLLIVLLLITIFPELTVFLPRVLLGVE